jgi:hypothetical protein
MRRLADTVKLRQPQKSVFVRGTIDHVTPSASRDGRAAAFVQLGGDIIPAPYYLSYTPTAGDLVDVRLDDGSPLILGRIVGLPTF